MALAIQVCVVPARTSKTHLAPCYTLLHLSALHWYARCMFFCAKLERTFGLRAYPKILAMVGIGPCKTLGKFVNPHVFWFQCVFITVYPKVLESVCIYICIKNNIYTQINIQPNIYIYISSCIYIYIFKTYNIYRYEYIYIYKIIYK